MPGLEWLKLDDFSAKGVTQGHDTIIEYYRLANQLKKRGVKLLLHPRDIQLKVIDLLVLQSNVGPGGFSFPIMITIRGHWSRNFNTWLIGSVQSRVRTSIKEDTQTGRGRSKVGSIARRQKHLPPASPPKILNLTIKQEFPSKLPW